MKKQLFFGSFLALLCGGFIYILFRTTTLKMFGWYKVIGLGGAINKLRNWTFQFADDLPEWILFSLPDGLWIFSYVCLMLAIWHNSVSLKNSFWILAVPILAIGSEIGQFLGLVIGTFDFTDLLFYIFGMTLPFIFFTKTINLKS
ncbi:MAG: hypothetical protein ACK5H1_01815 [Tenacibaculum sp.]